MPSQGESWAQGLHSTDYQLLCRDGTRSPVTDYEKCHLARVPSRGIVVHSDISSSVVYNMLREGLQKSGFSMFSSSGYGGTNLLFSDSSTTFIEAGNENYIEWLGRYYYILKAMDCTQSGSLKKWAANETLFFSLQNKQADAITLDGGYIYTAGKSFGLIPAVGESYTG
ncbi:melanotransferrin [Labeo rohita]|uniref:Melanotransferrin n=1 Tax=Labeo rohita TaxID=84645 RepID=A0A498P598_LABRO|nr:melanotransferrin [Labeo rohita]